MECLNGNLIDFIRECWTKKNEMKLFEVHCENFTSNKEFIENEICILNKDDRFFYLSSKEEKIKKFEDNHWTKIIASGEKAVLKYFLHCSDLDFFTDCISIDEENVNEIVSDYNEENIVLWHDIVEEEVYIHYIPDKIIKLYIEYYIR